MDSVTKALHCKAKYAINLIPDPTVLDTGDLIPLSNLPKPQTLICTTEYRPFPLEFSTYRFINRSQFYEHSFSAGPYYLAQNMLTCQGNAATMDSLCTYYVFNKILFDYFKTYHRLHSNQTWSRIWCYWLQIFHNMICQVLMSKYQTNHSEEEYWIKALAWFTVNLNRHSHTCCNMIIKSSTEKKRNFNGH